MYADATEYVDVCPYCECENVYEFDEALANGYKIVCWNCGREIFLCDACRESADNPTQLCDWSGRTRGEYDICKCFRGEIRRKILSKKGA